MPPKGPERPPKTPHRPTPKQPQQPPSSRTTRTTPFEQSRGEPRVPRADLPAVSASPESAERDPDETPGSPRGRLRQRPRLTPSTTGTHRCRSSRPNPSEETGTATPKHSQTNTELAPLGESLAWTQPETPGCCAVHPAARQMSHTASVPLWHRELLARRIAYRAALCMGTVCS